MKLIKITDVRPGQVWKREDRLYLISVDPDGDPWAEVFFANGEPQDRNVYQDEYGVLAGFFGITHRIVDGRLAEIPRTADIQVDDVVELPPDDGQDTGPMGVVTHFVGVTDRKKAPRPLGYIVCLDDWTWQHESAGVYFDKCRRIGILGVDWEFVNDKLAEADDAT
jgi:hypothetical protein